MNKQELIKKIKDLPFSYIYDEPYLNKEYILDIIKRLEEPQKVKVPQFVADWIEVAKTVYSLSGGMTYGGPGVNKWLENEDNQRTFTLAWFDGYEVEEEPKYTVRVKGINGYGQYLNKASSSKTYCFASEIEKYGYKTKHTRKELEDANFGWVFECPGIEIEEVTE